MPTNIDVRAEESLIERFERQVAQDPDALAIVCADACVSYAELNRRANQLAWYLRARGVGPESIVALSIERSPALMIGILGILKAGGAYLPLDPSYPQKRLEFMMRNAGTHILVTQAKGLTQSFPTAAVQHSITLDNNDTLFAHYSSENPPHISLPENLAYVIYTSGSTGQPKGVMITYHAVKHLSNCLYETIYAPLASQGPLRISLNASVSFDSSVKQLVQLQYGHTLLLIDEHTHRDSQVLTTYIQEYGLQVLDCTPSLLRMLLTSGLLRSRSALQLLLIGGEPIDASLWTSLLARAQTINVYNVYGPAEGTVNTTVCQITPSDSDVSIGRPLQGTEVYLLDARLQPVAPGEPGELYIGGERLARGYLHRPDLTAERFIPHPFSSLAGMRLYRTGDIARSLADGKIAFIGRSDQQVKLHGYRIEPGEIESALREHPAVIEAAATVFTHGIDQRLAAYIVPDLHNCTVPADAELLSRRVEEWRVLHDELHRNPLSSATFNIRGWNSSYTAAPLSEIEMEEWVQQTVQRIADLNPKHILEIGCGTGLLLHRLAPVCDTYVATDISQVTLDLVQDQVERLSLGGVRLLRRDASDFTGIDVQKFDVVVLNSIIQYFPSVLYLESVLQQAVECVRPGGFIFIGDVRSLPLLEAFHASVELSRSEPFVTREQLYQRTLRRLYAENELVVHPQFFAALPQSLARHVDVAVLPKQGRFHNEMTRFRYDVILRIVGKQWAQTPTMAVDKRIASQPSRRQEAPEPFWLHWEQERMTIASLRQLLSSAHAPSIGCSHIPNARVQADLETWRWLTNGDGPETVGEFQALSLHSEAVDPELLEDLSQECSYKVQVSWASAHEDGSFDALFVRSDLAPLDTNRLFSLSASLPAPAAYANDPLQEWRLREASRPLVLELKEFLRKRLPDYMLPATITALSRLPLAPGGKLDRRALPTPSSRRPEVQTPYSAPRTREEAMLAALWKDVLGIEDIGIDDNFFELGGNSLLGAQLMNRVQQILEEIVYIIALFDAPTVAQMCLYLNRHYPQSAWKFSGSTSAQRQGTRRQGRVSSGKLAKMRELLSQHLIPGDMDEQPKP